MTDYKEEQHNELEALESIYPDELQVVSTKPHHTFQLQLFSSVDNDDDAIDASCILQFTYTATYPDEAPIMEIVDPENLDDEHIDQLLELMKEQAEENLGMVMAFTIYSAAQEKINEMVENRAAGTRNDREAKIQAEEEAEAKRFEGTRVTIESFLSWKDKFDAEMDEIKRLKGLATKSKNAGKLTGKEMFLQNSALDDSDVKFLEEEGEKVEVDESLFQNMEDLDIDDELLDDDDIESGAVGS